MGSAVKSRLNHYEMLGLRPSASAEEIAQAFGRAMRLPHGISELAQLGIAFDTLRNPAKRRAYDEKLGIRPEPQQHTAPPAMSFRVSARLAAIAAEGPVEAEPASRPALPIGTKIAQAPLQERLQSSVSQSRPHAEKLMAPGSPVLPRPERQVGRGAAPDLDRGSRIEDIFALRSDAHGPKAFRSSRTAILASGVVVAVVLIAAWAGSHVKDSDPPQPAQSGVTVALPEARPQPEKIEDPAAPPSRTPGLEAFAAPAAPVASSAKHGPRQAQDAQSRIASISEAVDAVPSGSGWGGDTSGDASAQASEAPVAAANMPLPSAVIARTIDRIGYPCGSIASTSPGNGAGVFKITCTSGQSYQAKPVHGRYRFKRW